MNCTRMCTFFLPVIGRTSNCNAPATLIWWKHKPAPPIWSIFVADRCETEDDAHWDARRPFSPWSGPPTDGCEQQMERDFLTANCRCLICSLIRFPPPQSSRTQKAQSGGLDIKRSAQHRGM